MFNKAMVIMLSTDLINQINEKSDKEPQTTLSTGENFLQLIGLIFVLIFILAAAYFTTRLVGNYKNSQLKNSNFKVIDSYRISPNKVMQIVKMGNKYIVIAVCKDNVNFITELEESEVLIKEPDKTENQSFKQVFEKIRHNKG